MADAYGKTVGGRLQLKGGVSLKSKHKKSKKKKKTHTRDGDDEKEAAKEGAGTTTAGFELVKVRGSGRILSSGTTVMGQVGTKFLLELAVGDAMIIQHPTTLVEETRIVRMVLSDVSCSLSSAFSSDLVSSTPFQYIKAPPPELDAAEDVQTKKKRKRKADETLAFGTYAGGTETGSTVTFRVKKGGVYGGYAVVTERADQDRSREDLLDLRAKKKGDRHCM